MNLSTYIQHSGGAIGSDIAWTDIGKAYGLTDCRHYWHGSRTPHGNTEVSEDELQEGWEAVLLANKTLHRQPDKFKSLLSRNWLQVKHAQAVYAIASLRNSKEVNGGTGWAVQMAIDDYRDVYVFDQVKNQWYYWDYGKEVFAVCYAPALTQHFAGIGTREINDNGRTAILGAYTKTIYTLNGVLK